MTSLELTDYADRYIVERFSVVDGVARLQLGGSRDYAMRIWLDRDAMASRGVTVQDHRHHLAHEPARVDLAKRGPEAEKIVSEHIALGEREEALEYLEKAFADKDVRTVFLKIDPMWEPLRTEARFIAIMGRMNFH